MKCLRILTMFLLLVTVGFAVTTNAKYIVWAAQSATGQTMAINVMTPDAPSVHSVQLTITGSPTTCTYAFEGTAKDSGSAQNLDYQNISGDIDCSITGQYYVNGTVLVHVANKVLGSVRGNLKTLGGGTSPTVTLTYLGTR